MRKRRMRYYMNVTFEVSSPSNAIHAVCDTLLYIIWMYPSITLRDI